MRRGGGARRLRPPRVASRLAALRRRVFSVWSGAGSSRRGMRPRPPRHMSSPTARNPHHPCAPTTPRFKPISARRGGAGFTCSNHKACRGGAGFARSRASLRMGAYPRTCRGHDATRPAAARRYSAVVPQSRRSLARGSRDQLAFVIYAARSPIAMAQIAARGGASSVGSADNRERACTSRGA